MRVGTCIHDIPSFGCPKCFNLEEAIKSPTVTKSRKKRPMSQVAHDLMGRKNSTIKPDKDKGTRSEKEREALEEWTDLEYNAWWDGYENKDNK